MWGICASVLCRGRRAWLGRGLGRRRRRRGRRRLRGRRRGRRYGALAREEHLLDRGAHGAQGRDRTVLLLGADLVVAVARLFEDGEELVHGLRVDGERLAQGYLEFAECLAVLAQ